MPFFNRLVAVPQQVRWQEPLLWTLLVLVTAGIMVWAGWSQVRSASAVQPLSHVSDFALTERGGRTVTQNDLAGRVWIAAQTFNCCTMSCPQIRATLHQLQSDLRRTGVLLVSFSVDPLDDTPESLRVQADALGADATRWLFLTGHGSVGQTELDQFFETSFLTRPVRNAEAEPGLRVAHTSRLFLVNRVGQVVGAYSCVEEAVGADSRPGGVFIINEAELQRLARDADALDAGPLRALVRLSTIPTINAALNGTSAVLLLIGYLLIRKRKITAHAGCMLAAVGVSALFLASYLYYHFYLGHTRFPDVAVKPLYLAILASHVILAIVIVPLVIWTLYHAARGSFERHRRVARWTLPCWLYVSVTGVVVYVFLYHLYPQ
jgi:protein SCO1/2/putative membrane protein